MFLCSTALKTGLLQDCDRTHTSVHNNRIDECSNQHFLFSSPFPFQSPPKGATIPYRPKPQVNGPVIVANGQAYTIQGNYAVPAQEVCIRCLMEWFTLLFVLVVKSLSIIIPISPSFYLYLSFCVRCHETMQWGILLRHMCILSTWSGIILEL